MTPRPSNVQSTPLNEAQSFGTLGKSVKLTSRKYNPENGVMLLSFKFTDNTNSDVPVIDTEQLAQATASGGTSSTKSKKDSPKAEFIINNDKLKVDQKLMASTQEELALAQNTQDIIDEQTKIKKNREAIRKIKRGIEEQKTILCLLISKWKPLIKIQLQTYRQVSKSTRVRSKVLANSFKRLMVTFNQSMIVSLVCKNIAKRLWKIELDYKRLTKKVIS